MEVLKCDYLQLKFLPLLVTITDDIAMITLQNYTDNIGTIVSFQTRGIDSTK